MRRPTIEGSKRFKSQVSAALDLLEERVPEVYVFVCNYIGIIRESPRSGIWVHEAPVVFDLSPRSCFYSTTWCAGVIVHEAYHVWQYKRYLAINRCSEPTAWYKGVATEMDAIAYQLAVMKALEAPVHELDWLQSQDGSHFDIDGDGDYDWEDYRLRDW